MKNKPSISEILLVVVAVAVAISLYFTPYSGDDWVYYGAYTGYKSVCHNPYEWLKLGFGHWLTTNGRFANIGLTPLLLLPKWLLSTLCGIAMYVMCKSAAKISNNGSENLSVTAVMVSLLVFTLPWWDSMMVFDCQFNYVFSSAFCLSAYCLMYSKSESKYSLLLKSLFCFIAGMMHEAASMPMLIGLIFYTYFGGTKPAKNMFYAFAAGTLIVTFAPGIWLRASNLSTPDDILPVLLLKSDAAALLLLFGLLVYLLKKDRRERLKMIIKTPIVIFIVASLVSMVMSGVSGIVGRSGWFAEIYAFIVIIYFLKGYLRKLHKTIYIFLSLIVTVHLTYVAYYQSIVCGEYEKFDSEYVKSSDGIVFMDYTRDDELSVFLLNKLRGVPDPDDTYLLKTYSEHYSAEAVKPIVLPSEAKKVLAQEFTGNKVLKCGDVLSDILPENTTVREDGLMLCNRGGKEIVIQPFIFNNKKYYHLSERIIDPGDR